MAAADRGYNTCSFLHLPSMTSLATFLHIVRVSWLQLSSRHSNQEEAMLGAAEFTAFGNIMMGIMAVVGVCSMIYAVGTALSHDYPGEWKLTESTPASKDAKKAA
jgi:hypothetical protein